MPKLIYRLVVHKHFLFRKPFLLHCAAIKLNHEALFCVCCGSTGD